MARYVLTSDQALAHARLSRAIQTAIDGGRHIPCRADPDRWDDASNPATLCDGCPVLDWCRCYADTGAVTHGVIAGRQLPDSPRRPRVAHTSHSTGEGPGLLSSGTAA